MAKDTLAVYDPSHWYVERFLGCLHACKEISFEAVGFTDLKILQDYLQNNRIKALLLSRQENEELQEDTGNCINRIINMKNVVFCMLGEQEADREWAESVLGKETAEKINYIEKYQAVGNIIRILKSVMNSSEKNRSSGKEAAYRLEGMYSPADKTSHPDLAVMLAKRFRQESGTEGSKILYISLEQFSGLSGIMDHRADADLSDVIFCYRTNKGKLPEMLRRAVGTYKGLNCLLIAGEESDLNELHEGSWPDFFQSLSESGGIKIFLVEMSVFNLKLACEITKNGSLYIPAIPSEEENTRISLLEQKHSHAGENSKMAEYRYREFKKFLLENDCSEILESIRELEI